MKKNAAVAQVRVSLKDGLTILDLKPGNTVTLTALRQIITNNGFVSKEVTGTARGTLSPDQKTFVVEGTNERLSLSSAAHRKGDDWLIAIRAPDKHRARSIEDSLEKISRTPPAARMTGEGQRAVHPIVIASSNGRNYSRLITRLVLDTRV